MSAIKKIIVKANRNYYSKKEKREDERLRRQPDRSPLLLVLYLCGLAGLIMIVGEAIGAPRSLFPLLIGGAALLTLLLWFLYFYHPKGFAVASGVLVVGIGLLVAPDIMRTAAYLTVGYDFAQLTGMWEPLVILSVLAVYLLFSLEFVLRNHFVMLLAGVLALAAIPGSGYGVEFLPGLLLIVFEIGFVVLNMTERRRLRDSLAMKKKSKAGMVCALFTAALMLALFAPALLIEQTNEENLFHAVYMTDSYLKDLFTRMTGGVGDTVTGGHINRGNLYQTGEEILKVQLDKRPVGRVYLHSFRGKDYDNGEWDNAYQFINYRYENGYTETVYQEPFLKSLMIRYENKADPISGISGQFNELSYPTSDPVTELYYLLADGTKPLEYYYSDYYDPEGNGDFSSYNNPNQELINVDGFSISIRHLNENYMNTLLIPYYSAKSEGRIWGTNQITRDGGYRNSFLYPSQQGMAEKWIDYGFYEEFVDDYIKETLKEYRSYPGETFTRLEEYCKATPLSTLDEITTYILVTLQNKARYTTTPGTTPYNKDVIDYFLFDNGQGYCVHFASAATMMYRMYGVPARYVSGFVVEPGMLQEETNEAGGTFYTATVTDEYAHAWVEIFLKDYGWVPVEVTPTDTGTMIASFPGYNEVLMRRIMREHGWSFREDNASQLGGGAGDAGEQLGQVLRISAFILLPAALVGGSTVLVLRRRYRLKKLPKLSCRKLFDRFISLLHACKLLTEMNGSEKDFDVLLSAQCTGLSPADCTRFIGIMQKVNFSESKATQQERDFLQDCYCRLALELYARSSFPRKLYLKFLRGFL